MAGFLYGVQRQQLAMVMSVEWLLILMEPLMLRPGHTNREFPAAKTLARKTPVRRRTFLGLA